MSTSIHVHASTMLNHISSLLFGLLFLLPFLFIEPLQAQVPSDTSDIDPDVEAVLDDLVSEEGNPTQLAEFLTALAAHPLDINTASAADLSLIPALSPSLAVRIVRYRQQNGPFHSLSAVHAVPGLTRDHLQRARPYLRLGAKPSLSSEPSPYPAPPSLATMLNDLDWVVMQRVTRRLDLGQGYDADTTRTTFLGSPERLYTRLRVSHQRHLSLGLLLDKDPGELFQWNRSTNTYGFDHVSGHLALQDFGRLERLIVGDFSAEFGQGVTLWRSMAFGKGRDPVSPMVRSGRGLVPYASTEENRFFRGLATTIRLTPWLSASAWASRRTLDATVDSVASASPSTLLMVTSQPETGLHRTPSELARKDALRESMIGSGLEYDRGFLRLGVVGYRSRFSPPLAPGDRTDEYFDWAGTTLSMLGAYANIFAGNFHLFGEITRSPRGTLGGTGGLEMQIASGAHALILGRYYPPSFSSPHGHAFGERNGATQNEMGLYVGLRLRIHPDWRMAVYFDQYRFPWLRFGVPRPSSGYDARLVIEHEPRSWLSHYVQVRSETREAATELESPHGFLLNAVRPETRQSIRWHGQYTFSERLRLQTRLEGTRFDGGDAPHHGLLLYQDVRWRPSSRLRFDGRLAFFDTDGFDTRVYTYEHDLLYAFALPVFSGRGQRRYLMATLQATSSLDLQAKYGVTTFQNVENVGSGLNTVPGNHLREIGVQLRWSL